LENQANHQLQNFICDLEFPINSYGQSLEKDWEGHFLWHFQISSLNFVYNFWLKFQYNKEFVEVES